MQENLDGHGSVAEAFAGNRWRIAAVTANKGDGREESSVPQGNGRNVCGNEWVWSADNLV
jgi:hypothetical protein